MAAKLDLDSDDLSETHEINVTPFIDVMLVLLIIFMVAAPLATADFPVDLPSAVAQEQPRPDEPIYLAVKADLSLALGDRPVAAGALGAALNEATGGDRDTRVFLYADKKISYGDLMTVMTDLQNAGYFKIALVGLEDAAPNDTVP